MRAFRAGIAFLALGTSLAHAQCATTWQPGQRAMFAAGTAPRGRPSAAASGLGKTKVGDVAVEQFVLWIDGCATTFGLGDDGRIRTATFRGRGPQLWFGEVVHTFGDYTEAAGIVVPTTLRATFEGKPSVSRPLAAKIAGF